MATTSSGKEERRRRIVERGSDRMALITGRMKTLPSSSSSSPSETLQFPRSDLDPQIQANTDQNAGSSGSRSPKQEYSGDKAYPENGFNVGKRLESQLQSAKNKPDLTLIAPAAPPSNGAFPPTSKPITVICSSKQINDCIAASEGTRFLCSVMIALLVVQSYTSFPLLNRKSIIAWRPLYIVLLTDVTIVLGLLLLQKRGGTATERDSSGSLDDGHTWDGAVSVLEKGLVLHQTVRAVFIDCSVYIVIVVCGFSLMHL